MAYNGVFRWPARKRTVDLELDDVLKLGADSEQPRFLVGAGISRNLPGTREVIQATLSVLFESLGQPTSRRFVAAFLDQSVGSQRFDDPLRFEYLMQVVKDYFGRNLTFLKTIFEARTLPNLYHRGLAQLLQQRGNVVLTTNFDRQIERAYQSVGRPGDDLAVTFREGDFRHAANSVDLAGLFKLHGSVDDVRTLGATFDANRPNQWKNRFLENTLREGPSFVFGYSGSDDTDIVPAMILSRARGQPIIWVVHRDDEPNVYSLNHPEEIPDELRQENGYIILDRMLAEGSREPGRVFLVVGRSETVFCRLLHLRGISDCNETESLPGEVVPGQQEIGKLINAWYQQGDLRRTRLQALLVGVVLSYIAGKGNMTNRFANRLADIADSDEFWHAIALPKLSLAEYDQGRFNRAVDFGRQGVAATTAEWRKGNPDPHLRNLMAEARIDVHTWLAEAYRMQGKMADAERVVREGITALAETKSVSNWRRLRRTKGDLLSTLGEIHLVRGNLADSRVLYAQAASEHRMAGEWNWHWYDLLGIADHNRMAGQLQMASEEYQRVRQGSYVTGWRTWLYLQIRLSELDLKYVQKGTLSDDEISELERYDANEYDESMEAQAAMIRWASSLGSGPATSFAKAEKTYLQLLENARGDKDFGISLNLFHAEYLKHNGMLKDAEQETESVITYAGRKGYKLLELHARTVREDVHRLAGIDTECKPLITRYRELGCPLGELYATSINICDGSRVTRRTRERLRGYAQGNGLNEFSELLTDDSNTVVTERPLVLRFPGITTNF